MVDADSQDLYFSFFFFVEQPGLSESKPIFLIPNLCGRQGEFIPELSFHHSRDLCLQQKYLRFRNPYRSIPVQL